MDAFLAVVSGLTVVTITWIRYRYRRPSTWNLFARNGSTLVRIGRRAGHAEESRGEH